MPVRINTNTAATIAANNLASTSALLQRSLGRLSSGSKIINPADDAGGLAVAMKLSAATRRMNATQANISNVTSYLQTQDGALSVAAKAMERIGVLKALSSDATKNTSDIANYNSEFEALQNELKAVAGETFNGKALFGTSSLSTAVSEDQQQAVNTNPVDLMSAGSSAQPAPDLFSMDGWIDTSAGGSATIAGGTMTLTGSAELTTRQTYAIPGNINFSYHLNASSLSVYLGDTEIFNKSGTEDLSAGIGIFSNANYAPGPLRFKSSGPVSVTDLAIAMSQDAGGASNVYLVANATNLQSLSLSTVTAATQDLATYRAENGATQSRLGFAMELLVTNRASMEQAHSRIMDVDIAEESTVLAKNNVLVQSGNSMLTQANQAPSSILRLLG